MARLFIEPEDPSKFPRFYNESLINNYGDARGYKVVNVSRINIRFDIENFVKERGDSMMLVQDLLNARLIDYRDCDTIEYVENREFVVSNNVDCDTTIVTPDVNIYKDVRRDRVILKRIKIYNSLPYLVDKNRNRKLIDPRLFKTIMIMNPYFESIRFYERFATNPDYNIIIGNCGKTYDKDIEYKIDQMDELYTRTNGILHPYFVTRGSNYAYVLTSENLRSYK